MAGKYPINRSAEPVRESPSPESLHCGLTDPSHPDASNEPVLNIDNIQGNILAGFMKDHQAFVFLTLNDEVIDDFKEWLLAIQPFIASTAEVLAFNRLFKEIRTRRNCEPTGIMATWINIAFSFKGIKKLAQGTELDIKFEDEAFTAGLAARSRSEQDILGDPSRGNQTGFEGHPDNWVLGGNEEIHVVIIVASDDKDELDEHQASGSILSQILHGSTDFPSELRSFGTFKVQHGNNLPAEQNLAGHEHFGFLDNISQPGIRGRISNDPHDVLIPRQNPNNRDQGKPGQELIWPGEFVFGYPQSPSNPQGQEDPKKKFQSPGPISSAGPDWANDGSFLVIRRLRQDVEAFHTFLKQVAEAPDPNISNLHVLTPPALRIDPPTGTPVVDSPADVVGARLVGRWRSGAPVLRTLHPRLKPNGTPDDLDQLKNDQDNPFLANNDCANNNFEFQENTEQLPHSALRDPFDCADENDPESQDNRPFQPAHNDKLGLVCPFTGHNRKVYPRDDQALKVKKNEPLPPLIRDGSPVQNDEGEEIITNEDDTQTHRILRRGIPFGDASNSTPDKPSRDKRDDRPEDKELGSGRGLVFLAYQTSIVDQFEFITRNWANNPDFKEPQKETEQIEDPETGVLRNRRDNERGGHDPIIGQNNKEGEDRVREFTVTFQNEKGERIAKRVNTGPNGPGKIGDVKKRDWVIPTGGEYFFAPSIAALKKLAGA